MRERQEPIPPLQVELAPVHRVGTTGRRFLTRKAAYLAAARAAYSERYDEPEPMGNGTYGDVPFALTPEQQQRDREHRERIVGRLARFLQYRDNRWAAGAR